MCHQAAKTVEKWALSSFCVSYRPKILGESRAKMRYWLYHPFSFPDLYWGRNGRLCIYTLCRMWDDYSTVPVNLHQHFRPKLSRKVEAYEVGSSESFAIWVQ